MALQFSSEQHAIFERDGMLPLPALIPAQQAAGMAAVLWRDLESRFGMVRGRPNTWPGKTPGHFQGLVRSNAFQSVLPVCTAAGDAFLGAGTWLKPAHLPLVTFPTGGWDVPHNTWHFDEAPGKGLSMVKLFVMLESVEPRGGGTPYVEGSHRVAMERARANGAELRSAEMRDLLKREEPWFAALFAKEGGDRVARFMDSTGEAGGVRVRVKEMTGAPGDAYLMHGAMLHTVAPNGLRVPRMMLTSAIYRRPG